MAKRSLRTGFTLLEVTLALSLSVLLLAALYLALSTQFYHARVGRELMDETNLVRGLLSKITSDINGNLAPINPFYVLLANNASNGNSGTNSSGNSGSGSGSSGGGASGNNGSGGGNSGNSGSGSGNSGSGSGNSSTTNPNPAVPAYAFNLGIEGDNSSFVLMVGRTPSELAQYIGNTQNQAPTDQVSDLRRITYMVIPGKGLARQEETNVTNPNATVTAPPTFDGDPVIIAKEVQEMTVRYYGSLSSIGGQPDWQQSWDGTTIDSTTSLPLGPPAAIEITLKIQMPAATRNGEGRQVTVRHVVAIQTANRWVTAQPNPNTGQ